jgi:hypothetical protein
MKFRETFIEGAPNSQKPKHYLSRSILLLLLVAYPGLLQAQFTYTITTNLTVTITGYTGPGGMAVIPSSISGFPVTSIVNNAFAYSGLTNIFFPNTLTNIAVSSRMANVFGYCLTLQAINVDVNNPSYSSADGVLFDKSQSTLLQFPYGKVGSYTIPNSVTNIGEAAFAYGTMTTVTVPDSVINIGGEAFSWCNGLSTVTLGTNLASIGPAAFYACNLLSNIALPNSLISLGTAAFEFSGLTNASMGNQVKAISESAFQYTPLTSFTIPAGVTEIAIGAFANCPNLQGVIIPNSVTNIPEGAFESSGLTSVTIPDSVIYLSGFNDCRALTNVVIGKGVTTIGAYALTGCIQLTNVTIGASVTTIEGSAFASCTGLTHFQIGSGVGTIWGYAFQYCSNLRDIIISKSVTNIGQYAFDNCPSLSGVYFEGLPPTADSTVFNGDNISISYYLPGTPGWGPVFANRPAIPWFLPNPLILTSSLNFAPQNTGFAFVISWATNAQVVVEAAQNLPSGAWATVSTNNLTNGWSYFTDSGRTNYPKRFYRIRSL